MEILEKVILTASSKEEILTKTCEEIEMDYPQFDGDVYGQLDFKKVFESENFNIEVKGKFYFRWLSHEEYQQEDLGITSIKLYGEDGNLIKPGGSFIDKIESNINLSIQ